MSHNFPKSSSRQHPVDILEHPLLQKRRSELATNMERIQSKGFEPTKFCIMPFVNIILEPDGSVGLCRHKGTDFSLGNLKESTWEEIWNGAKAQAWRKEFLLGEPVTCTKELKEQHCNLCPQLGKMLPQVEDFKEKMPPPLRLTANFNGRCNLQCQMCDVWELPNGFYTEENFWRPGRTHLFPFLKEIDMLSGEPFIQEDTYKLIDEVSALNKDCLWSITTNAHWRFNKKLKEALNKIRMKNLILSVDSLDPETYHKIRKPGKLSLVLKAIEDLCLYEKERKELGLGGLHMNLNFLIQKDNWREIPEVIDFCLAKNIHPFITFCYRPDEHSLLSLPLDQRKEILQHYLYTFSWAELSLSHRVLQPLLQSLPPLEKGNFLIKLDQLKKEYEKSYNRPSPIGNFA